LSGVTVHYRSMAVYDYDVLVNVQKLLIVCGLFNTDKNGLNPALYIISHVKHNTEYFQYIHSGSSNRYTLY